MDDRLGIPRVPGSIFLVSNPRIFLDSNVACNMLDPFEHLMQHVAPFEQGLIPAQNRNLINEG